MVLVPPPDRHFSSLPRLQSEHPEPAVQNVGTVEVIRLQIYSRRPEDFCQALPVVERFLREWRWRCNDLTIASGYQMGCIRQFSQNLLQPGYEDERRTRRGGMCHRF
jgi:hypothetical protein